MIARSLALRHSPRDAILVLLAGVHGALLVAVPSAPLVAIALWWNANTVSHNFIHLPFFRSRNINALFSMFLSALLGLPQTLWRDRHVAHHTNRKWRFQRSPQMLLDTGAALAAWGIAAANGLTFFLTTWLLGWLAGMLLCQLQGYYEHVRGTVSHYGWLYNKLFFNDGYHVEHHARPGLHWTALRNGVSAERPSPTHSSAWPAVLRWIETAPLDLLERAVLHSGAAQRWIVDQHARAFAKVLEDVPLRARVTIIGGGIFPRTALVLRRFIPDAQITIVDRSADSIARARTLVDASVIFIQEEFTASHATDADLLIVPLAFSGDRTAFYDGHSTGTVIIHDWIWRRRGNASAVVSPLLLKRLNRVSACT